MVVVVCAPLLVDAPVVVEVAVGVVVAVEDVVPLSLDECDELEECERPDLAANAVVEKLSAMHASANAQAAINAGLSPNGLATIMMGKKQGH